MFDQYGQRITIDNEYNRSNNCSGLISDVAVFWSDKSYFDIIAK
jgi:hypothetical protein